MDFIDWERLLLIIVSTVLTKSAFLNFQLSSRDFGLLVTTPWRSLTLFQLLISMLEGPHFDPEGAGNASVVHFPPVVNLDHDHGTSHF